MNNYNNALPPGTVLDSGSTRYVIAGVIGQGGFGITYRATTPVMVGNIPASITVAIKEFFIAADCERTRVANSQDTTMITYGPARERVAAAMRDFVAEANRLRTLAGASPNIVCVNEVFNANGTAYYVMEYLDGPSLRDYVNARGPMSESEAVRVMMPLFNAVNTLHSRRIMHLDIKPSNVVMAGGPGSMRPVLIDFGRSKHYDDAGSSTRTVGAAGLSDGYAPIEQYSGITRFSPETDVYALAATMLFCLTGNKPPRAMDMNVNDGSLFPATVTPHTRAVIARALAMNPAERTPTVAALIDDLTGISVPPPPPPAAKRSGNWSTWMLAGIALLLVEAIVFICIKIFTDANEQKGQYIVPEIEDVTDAEQPEKPVTMEEPAQRLVEEAEEAEVRSGTAPPLMHTYNFSGYFQDSTGQQWPVKLTANTNGEGRWGKCTYTNVSYNIVLSMTGSGSGDTFTFRTTDKGSDLTIRITYTGEGTWEGTATSGSKALTVVLYE